MGAVLALLAACADDSPPTVYDLASIVVTTSDGEARSLESFEPPVLIINFWASWCAPCVEELPALQRMAESLDKSQYQVLLISVDADPSNADNMLADLAIQLPAYVDPTMALANGVFGLTGFPETLVIESSGQLYSRTLGAKAWDKPEIWKKTLP